MKVVLFCGGMGMRLREHSERVPKPMVPIGYRPVLWHVMKYYAHFGHTDFILCLGFRADVIKEYFLTYNETYSNDFVLEEGGKRVTLLSSDIDEWRIRFVDTGTQSNIGQRLLAVREFLDEDVFLANYSDVLTDAHLPSMIDQVERSGAVGMTLAVRPNESFHLLRVAADGLVDDIDDVRGAQLWINGGYFVLRREIFDVLHRGEELVEEPFRRLAQRKALLAWRHDGFWAPMDTLKDKLLLDDLYQSGRRPWCVWEKKLSSDERVAPEPS
jgi:glucose-1-phosphate cytidylyltransferase